MRLAVDPQIELPVHPVNSELVDNGRLDPEALVLSSVRFVDDCSLPSGLVSEPCRAADGNPGASSSAECAAAFGEATPLERWRSLALGLAVPQLG